MGRWNATERARDGRLPSPPSGQPPCLVDKDNTTIIGGEEEKQKIEGRIRMIRKELEDTKSDYDREKLEERLAKLSGGVAVIRVDAPSESEMKAKKGSTR